MGEDALEHFRGHPKRRQDGDVRVASSEQKGAKAAKARAGRYGSLADASHYCEPLVKALFGVRGRSFT